MSPRARRKRFDAVFWDFGGVILASPFDAFREYETANGLPVDLIRSVNALNAHDDAWARIERSELSVEEFDEAFAAESEALGHRVRGSDVLALLSGAIRPAWSPHWTVSSRRATSPLV